MVSRIEHHELKALLADIDGLIPYIPIEQCETTITFLVPVLQTAIEAKNASVVPNHLDGKSGSELLQAILERRNKVVEKEKEEEEPKSRKRHLLQAEEEEHDSDSGEKLWAPFDGDVTPNIKEVIRFDRQHGEYGLFITATARWNPTKKFLYFANAESLKFIDDTRKVYQSKRLTLITVLSNGISNFPKTQELCDFLKQTKWGQSILKSL
jgi:hypothetical protein